MACRLPAKSMKVGAARTWPQAKRLFDPLRNDPAAKRGPLQNIETAEPVARRSASRNRGSAEPAKPWPGRQDPPRASLGGVRCFPD